MVLGEIMQWIPGALSTIWQWNIDALYSILQWITSTPSTIWQMIDNSIWGTTEILQWIMGAPYMIWWWSTDVIALILQWITGGLSMILQWITGALSTIWQVIDSSFWGTTEILKWITGTLSVTLEWITGGLSMILHWITGALSSIWQVIDSSFWGTTEILQGIGGSPYAILKWITGTLSVTLEWITGGLSMILHWITGALSSIWQVIDSSFWGTTEILQWLIGSPSMILQWIMGAFSVILQWIIGAFSTILQWLMGALSTILQWITSALSTIWWLIKGINSMIWERIDNWILRIPEILQWTTSALFTILQGITGAVSVILQWIITAFSTIWGGIMDIISTILMWGVGSLWMIWLWNSDTLSMIWGWIVDITSMIWGCTLNITSMITCAFWDFCNFWRKTGKDGKKTLDYQKLFAVVLLICINCIGYITYLQTKPTRECTALPQRPSLLEPFGPPGVDTSLRGQLHMIRLMHLLEDMDFWQANKSIVAEETDIRYSTDYVRTLRKQMSDCEKVAQYKLARKAQELEWHYLEIIEEKVSATKSRYEGLISSLEVERQKHMEIIHNLIEAHKKSSMRPIHWNIDMDLLESYLLGINPCFYYGRFGYSCDVSSGAEVLFYPIDLEGKYVRLRNIGEEQDLYNWAIKLKTESNKEVTYKFPQSRVLGVGQTVTVWSYNAIEESALSPNDEMMQQGKVWPIVNKKFSKVKATLVNGRNKTISQLRLEKLDETEEEALEETPMPEQESVKPLGGT